MASANPRADQKPLLGGQVQARTTVRNWSYAPQTAAPRAVVTAPQAVVTAPQAPAAPQMVAAAPVAPRRVYRSYSYQARRNYTYQPGFTVRNDPTGRFHEYDDRADIKAIK